MAVELKCETARGRALSGALRRDAARMLRLLGLEEGELSIVMVSDRAIRWLNRDYRGKDEATDVLSFPQIEAGRAASPARVAGVSLPPLALGDVVISVETACRQARALGVRPAARMRTLLIHGTLHLLGHDHERSAVQAQRMFARERELAARMAGGRSVPEATANGHPGNESSPVEMPTQRRSRAGKGVRRVLRA